MATVNQLNNNDTEWDDGPYQGYYTKDYNEPYGYDNDEGESFLDDIGGVIKSGVNAVGSILTNPIGTAGKALSGVGKILGVTSSPASTAGIQNRQGVNGSITTSGGKKIPVQVPEAAHRQDIQILQAAIQKINSEIKQVADTTTNNGVALTKLSGEVKIMNGKYDSTTKKQSELISKLGTGVDKLGKDLKIMKNQEQMNMMLSMFMQPSLESVTFAKQNKDNVTIVGDDTTAYEVKTSKSTDTMIPMLLMGMMGNDGGNGGGGFGDMGNNPLMMIIMMKALSGGGGIF